MTAETLDVAIVGAGASGSALAIALSARAGATFRAALFDPAEPGPGRAYAPQSASLLLNGPVRAMSIAAGDERHFQRWLVDEPGDALVCRARYGAYLRASLAQALAAHAGIRYERAAARALERVDGAWVVVDSRGVRTSARSVVFALGNMPPDDTFLPEALRAFSGYVRNPWSDAIDASGGDVAIVGTGLTAMDAIALLDEGAFGGRVHLISRHGLLPAVEDARIRGLDPKTLALDTSTPLALLRTLRRAVRASAADWRAVVDALRPITPAIWDAWTQRERKQFLRHARAMWGAHRYRVPPATYAAFARMAAADRVRVHSGRIADATIEGTGIILHVKHADREATVRASRVINCTGPSGDVTRMRDSFIASALRAGAIRPDALRLGVDVNDDLTARGAPGGIYAMGPMVRGRWFETTAVPEIVRHADRIATALLARERQAAAS